MSKRKRRNSIANLSVTVGTQRNCSSPFKHFRTKKGDKNVNGNSHLVSRFSRRAAGKTRSTAEGRMKTQFCHREGCGHALPVHTMFNGSESECTIPKCDCYDFIEITE